MPAFSRPTTPLPPPVTLTILGAVTLLDASGSQISAVLRQPKRVALMSYLALNGTGGFVRRDQLLALFWPDLGDARARNALNKSVHHLRQALGDGVLVGRGDEELGLAADRVRCDALEFRQACALQDTGRALELYRGELLPGFYLSDAPVFEEWLERERSLLNWQAARAARALAEALNEAGNGAAAADAGRRGVALAGHDEPTVRWFMALLDQQGDRAGALRVYDDFATRLRADFEVEPDAETGALRREIAERKGGSPHSPPATPPHDRTLASTARSEPVAPPPESSNRWFPRAPLVGLAALAGIVLLLLAVGKGREGKPPLSPHTFAILPFTTSGADTALIRLGRDLMVLVSARVNGIADIEVIDPVAVLAQVDARAVDRRDDRLRSALHSLGATQILQGSLIRVGDRVRIDGRLFATGAGRPVARIELTAPDEDLVALADSVVLQLVGQLWPAGVPPGPGAPVLSTRSLPALRAFLDGERLLAEGRMDDAAAKYGAAIAADSSFWFAYWRYLYFRDDFGRSMDSALAERLREHRDLLPEPERTLVEARFTDSLAVKQRLLAGAVARYQSSWDAWYNYADFLYHWGPYHGSTLTVVHQALERAVALNPGFTNAWDHLFRVSLQEGDTVAAHRALQALERLHYDSATVVDDGLDLLLFFRWFYATLKAGGRPQPELSESVASVLVTYHGPFSFAVFDALPLRFGMTEAQIEFGERVLARSPSRVIADGQMRGLALAWAARGAWESALATADRYAAGTSLAEADLFRYRLVVIGAWLGGVPAAEAERRRSTAAQRVTELPPDAAGEFAWLDGVLASARGDVEGIEQARRRVRGVPAPMGGWLDRSLAGLALALRGEQAASIAALAKVEGERYGVHPFDRSNFQQPYLTAVNRMVLSRGLATMGDTVEALRQLRWVEAYLQNSSMLQAHTVMPALVALEQAHLEEASGQQELAQRHYREFLRRYDMPVPAHRALVAVAEASLGQLQAIACPSADSACGAVP